MGAMDAEVVVAVVGWGGIYSAGPCCACACESAQLREKEGNEVQMFSIKHRAAELQ